MATVSARDVRPEPGPGFVGRALEALLSALPALGEFEFRLLGPLRILQSELLPERRPLGRDLDPLLRLASEKLPAEPVEPPPEVGVVDAELLEPAPKVGVVGPELFVLPLGLRQFNRCVHRRIVQFPPSSHYIKRQCAGRAPKAPNRNKIMKYSSFSGRGDPRPRVALAAADRGEVDAARQRLEIGPRERDGRAPRPGGKREVALLEAPARIQQPPGPKPGNFIIVRRRFINMRQPPEHRRAGSAAALRRRRQRDAPVALHRQQRRQAAGKLGPAAGVEKAEGLADAPAGRRPGLELPVPQRAGEALEADRRGQGAANRALLLQAATVRKKS